MGVVGSTAVAVKEKIDSHDVLDVIVVLAECSKLVPEEGRKNSRLQIMSSCPRSRLMDHLTLRRGYYNVSVGLRGNIQ